MLEMKIKQIGLDELSNMPFIVLADHSGEQKLPIWIGLFEASAIAAELENLQLERPLTHDLMHDLIDTLGGHLEKVEIHDLKDNIFFARLLVKQDNQTHPFDCRPSDAIALALRHQAPILADAKVITEAKKLGLTDRFNENSKPIDESRWQEILENLAPEDFGKYKM